MLIKTCSWFAASCLLAGVAASGCSAEQVSDDDVEEDAGYDGGGCLPDPDGGGGGGGETDGGSEDGAAPDAGDDGAPDVAPDVTPDHELADCPDDMVPVGLVCVDIYEASRPDATEQNQGSATGPAQSVAGVIPWHVPSMTPDAFETFETACNDAGKRICELSDWLPACEGPTGASYVFGDTFDAETCNCVDTFCDDWCAAEGIDPASCQTGTNCGYAYDCFHVTPTGSFPDCTNSLGTFDITGNVWEIVPSEVDSRGFEVRGGAYNCAGAEERLQCTFNAQWNKLFAGFRCCLDR